MIKIPKNVFSAFGVLFILTAMTIPVQNLIIWGPDFVYDFYTSPEFTAEKLSIGVIGLGIFFLLIGYKRKNEVIT